MLSMISIPVAALAVGLPAQRAIAQRFSALARSRQSAAARRFGSYRSKSRHARPRIQGNARRR